MYTGRNVYVICRGLTSLSPTFFEITNYNSVEFIIIMTITVFLIFFLLALQPTLGVVFYSPLAGFSLLAYEVS